MATTRTLTVTLPEELVQRIESSVANGEYPSESSYIEDHLLDLGGEPDETDLDRTLREFVVPIYDECAASPDSLLTLKQVRETIRRVSEENTATLLGRSSSASAK